MTGMAVQRIMVNMPERLNSVVATVPVLASGLPVDDETFAFFASMASDDNNFKAGMSALTSGRYGEGWATAKLKQNRDSVNSDAMKAYTSMWSREDFSADVKGNKHPFLLFLVSSIMKVYAPAPILRLSSNGISNSSRPPSITSKDALFDCVSESLD